jgi:hypothetical protein
MKKILMQSRKLSKQEQRTISGGELMVCQLTCADGNNIRCVFQFTCGGDPFNCCVQCDGQDICA